jgi:hypothetical protein
VKRVVDGLFKTNPCDETKDNKNKKIKEARKIDLVDELTPVMV